MHTVDNRCIRVDAVLQTRNVDIHSVGPFFHAECFEEKTLPACVTAVMGIEFVPMQRTYNIAQGIDVSIG